MNLLFYFSKRRKPITLAIAYCKTRHLTRHFTSSSRSSVYHVPTRVLTFPGYYRSLESHGRTGQIAWKTCHPEPDE